MNIKKAQEQINKRLDYHLDETVHYSLYKKWLDAYLMCEKKIEIVKRFLYSLQTYEADNVLEKLEELNKEWEKKHNEKEHYNDKIRKLEEEIEQLKNLK